MCLNASGQATSRTRTPRPAAVLSTGLAASAAPVWRLSGSCSKSVPRSLPPFYTITPIFSSSIITYPAVFYDLPQKAVGGKPCQHATCICIFYFLLLICYGSLHDGSQACVPFLCFTCEAHFWVTQLAFWFGVFLIAFFGYDFLWSLFLRYLSIRFLFGNLMKGHSRAIEKKSFQSPRTGGYTSHTQTTHRACDPISLGITNITTSLRHFPQSLPHSSHLIVAIQGYFTYQISQKQTLKT